MFNYTVNIDKEKDYRMMKNLTMMLLGALAVGLAACSGVSKASEDNLGFAIPDVYASADSFAERAYVTTRLYEATLDAAIFACDVTVNPKATETPDVICAKAAQAAEKLSPVVQAADHSMGVYLYLDSKVNDMLADGKVVPDEVLVAAAEAFYKARGEWAAIEKDIEQFNAN
jgi:hypothetical protein